MDGAGAGAGAGAAAGDAAVAGAAAADSVATLARVHVVLGWVAALFALFAVVAVNLHLQQGQCAATEAEAVGLRGDAMLLLLSGAAQAVAATLAASAPASWRTGWVWSFAAFAHGVSSMTFSHLVAVAPAAVAVVVGSCLHGSNGSGHYRGLLIAHYVLLAAPLCILYVVGLAVLIAAVLDLVDA